MTVDFLNKELSQLQERVSRLEENVGFSDGSLGVQHRQVYRGESIGRLAGGIAHEFNNLLTPIMGYADLNLLRMEPSNPLAKDLKAIKEAASRARELTLHLLALGRRQILDMIPIDVNDCIEAVIPLISGRLNDGVNFQFFPSEGLPPVNADNNQINQVLLILVENALEAMPDGGSLNVWTGQTILDKEFCQVDPILSPGTYVSLKLRDDGIGMNQEVKERIFEPFFSTKGENWESGLSLARVYGIVKQHKGHITVESTLGQGTAMTLFLPALSGVSEVKQDTIFALETSGLGESILVVEDEEIVRELTCEVLSRAGYDVMSAESAEKALSMVDHSAGCFSLLLTDVVMPGKNGRELYERLREISPSTEVLFMSGYADSVLESHDLFSDDGHLLRKPFSAEEILSKVRKILDGV